MLTKKQKSHLDYITKFLQKNGYAPSFEEIKKHFRLASKSTVHQQIKTLTQKGYLAKENYRARGISIIQDAPLSPVGIYTPISYEHSDDSQTKYDAIDKFLNKIICGDAVQVMQKMPTCSIDLTVTSPPYDELRNYNGYRFNFEGIATNLFRITKSGGVLIWVVGDKIKNGNRSLTSFKHALFFQKIGFNVHDVMIYKKRNTPFMRTNAYTNCFEFMFVLTKGKPKTFNPLKIKTVRQGQEMLTFNKGADGINKKTLGELKPKKTMTNIWEYAVGLHGTTSDKIAFEHPAVFPEKLAEDHILSWTKKGDIVFDPMCGSGTTCKMALKNNRLYIGCDISKEYVALSSQRLKMHALRLF